MKRLRTDSDILYYPFERSEQLKVYPESKVKEMIEFVTDKISQFYQKEKIYPT